MNLSDVQKRLQAPFPSALIEWKPGVITKDKARALLLAYVDARAIMQRLDAICPDQWAFDWEPVHGAPVPTAKGVLTVLGVTRADVGVGDAGSDFNAQQKGAVSDALKRCAVHFGIGRYLYDLPRTWAEWDDAKRQPKQTPTLPEWARPDHEQSPGGAHLAQAMEQLRYELPGDVDLQREVYKHLKAALSSLHPNARPHHAPRGAQEGQEGASKNFRGF